MSMSRFLSIDHTIFIFLSQTSMMFALILKYFILIMTGVYGRRSAASEAGSGEARERVRVMVPPHLYGQLAATR